MTRSYFDFSTTFVAEAVKQCPLSQMKKLSPEESRPGRSRPAWQVSLPAQTVPSCMLGRSATQHSLPAQSPPTPKGLWPDRGLCHLWHLEKESILKLIKAFQCGKYTTSVSHSSLGVSSCPDGKAWPFRRLSVNASFRGCQMR